MKKRWLALLLAALCIVSIFSGCGEKEEEGGNEPATSSKKEETATSQRLSKLAFQPQWISIEMPQDVQLQYLSDYTIIDGTMYFYGECKAGEQLCNAVTGQPVDEDYTGDTYTYTIYESNVFSMDLETHAVTRLEGYTPYEIPEGYEGNHYLSGIQAGTDGTIWLLEQVTTYYFDLPEDFNVDTQSMYDYYTVGENLVRLHQLDCSGKLLQTVDLSYSTETYINSLLLSTDGYIYAADWQTLYIYDLNAQQLGTIALENGADRLMEMKDGVYVVVWGNDGNALQPVDRETMTLGEGTRVDLSAYNLYPGNEEYDYIYNNSGTFYGHKAGEEEPVQLFSWLDCDVDSTQLYGNTIFGEDGYVYSLESAYETATDSSRYSLVVMEPVDPATLPVKQELTLAYIDMPWDMRSEIVAFNRSHDDVRIVVKDYSQYITMENNNGGLQKLNTEMMSGVLPDIFLFSETMPVSQYESKGYLQDLWPLIDSDEELSRDDLMTHFFDVLSNDGKLYRITDGFGISTLVGNERVVGSGSSWTVEEMMAALDSQPENTSVLGMYVTRSEILSSLIARNADRFIVWENQTCSFDTEEFISQLEFAKQFPEEIDFTNYTEDAVDSDAMLLRSGKQMLNRVDLYDFSNLIWNDVVMEGEANFIGYPSSNGNGSNFTLNISLGISSTCSNTEAAWEFVRTYLTEEHQSGNSYWWYFPTNRHSYESMVEYAMTMQYYEDDGYGEQRPIALAYIWYTDDDYEEIYTVTQAQMDKFTALYENCNCIYSYNSEIMDLINDQAAAYFAGQKTAEETARLIQDRVGLYVMENG